jgi:superfamily II DNA or RNA helicase
MPTEEIRQLISTVDRHSLRAPVSVFTKGWRTGLYTHQMEAIVEVITKGSGILKLATGSGKTWIMGELCRKLIIRQGPIKRVLIVVPKIDLLQQTIQSISRYLADTDFTVDYVGNGRKTTIWADITIGLVGSLIKVQGLETIDYAIFDESHYYLNRSGITLYNKLVGVHLITALSATPHFEEPVLNELVNTMFGDVLYEYTEKTAIDNQHISQPRIELYTAPAGKCSPKWLYGAFDQFKYNMQIRSLIINNTARNQLIADLVASNLSTLIIVSTINTQKNNHAEILRRLIADKYPNKNIVVAKSNTNSCLDVLKQSNAIVIAGPKLVSAGTDIPYLERIVITYGGSSINLLLQRVGRVLRRANGKTCGVVIDFIDPMGWPANQSKKRISTYKETYGAENVFIM